MPIDDPLLRQIESALNLPLDGNTFEAAICSMLREQCIYPKTVPVRGGGDAGMDGAIGDPADAQPPIPLVCTTQEEVKANLVRSLGSYKKKIGARNVAVSATSRALTPAMQRALSEAAKSEGFTLLNIYERSVVAEMLYKSPRWCRDLLGLTAVRPAISAFPQDNRPYIDQPLRGRDADLEWLNARTGDVLLSGQPGVGKTFLLRTYAKTHEALFAVTDDVTAIEAGIREQQPKAIIITDAHARPGLPQKLRQFRTDTGGTWAIVADCWPGAEKEVRQELMIATTSVRSLSLLPRDMVVEVIKDAGLVGPVQLVREIVDQARGRPGLAVTLTWLCLNGDHTRVGLGQALAEQVETTLKALIGAEAMDVLALLSLGGDAGVPLAAVASALGNPETQLQRVIADMAAGGVVEEGTSVDGRSRVLVQPRALRDTLVSERFFGSFSIGIPEAIMQHISIAQRADVFLGAAHRGGNVPDTLLRSLIGMDPTTELLNSYAALGEPQARWVLAQYPESLVSVARIGLMVAPAYYVPALLTLAIGDARPTHSNMDHPLRLIGDWVHAGRPGRDAIPRRRALVGAVEQWARDSGDADTVVQALALALVPTFDASELDPGAGMKVTLTRGVIRIEELPELASMWKAGLRVIRPEQVRNWRPLIDAVAGVASPHILGGSPGEDFYAASAAVAASALKEVAKVCASRPGVMLKLSRLATWLGQTFQGEVDAELAVLYPEDNRDDYEAGWARAIEAARELTRQLTKQQPRDVAAKLVGHTAEADSVGLNGGIIPHIVGCTLAEDGQRQGVWLTALRAAGCSAEHLAPLLFALYQHDPVRWAIECKESWAQPQLRRMVAMEVLSRENAPLELVATIMGWVSVDTDMVNLQSLRGRVVPSAMEQLLAHADPEVATAAAQGEWHRARPGEFRPEFVGLWRAAIVRSPTKSKRGRRSIGIGEMLSHDPALAFDWMLARIADGTPLYEINDYDLDMAIPALSADQRFDLLVSLAGSKVYAPSKFIIRLVNHDPVLYKRLLTSPQAKRIHMDPLATHPTAEWVQLASLALEVGYSPHEVYEATGNCIDLWTGAESVYREKWRAEWAALADSPDVGVRQVAEIGTREAEAQRDAAKTRERRESVLGR